jgi:ribonuclease HI
MPGGPCGWGWAAHDGEHEIEWGQGGLDGGTNNMAEYTALIMAMTHALAAEYDPDDEFAFEGDSKLVVMQTQGAWEVKADHLRPYFEQARHLWDGLRRPRVQWIEREQNGRADMLAGQGRDNHLVAVKTTKRFTRL